MKVSSQDFSVQESDLENLVSKSELTEEDENAIGYLLSSILTQYFSSLDRGTGLRSWCVDDMYPNKVVRSKNKVTLVGNIHWLDGGSLCKYYQADIATDTSPVLYSIKLKNNNEKQILYIGRTFTGWALNKT